MPSDLVRLRHLLTVLVLAAVAAPALAQDGAIPDGLDEPEVPRVDNPPEPSPYFSFRGYLANQFQANFDQGPGQVGATRFFADFGVLVPVSSTFKVKLSFAYGLEDYKFSGTTPFGSLKPFNDAHTFSFFASFDVKLSDDLTLVFGPIAESSRESGADFEDSWSYGGFVGVGNQFSDSFYFGGGVGVQTRLEADVRIFPLILVHWDITDNLRLVNRPSPISGGRTSLELLWDFDNGWDIAGGGGYYFRRFRLDDSGLAPNGVGDESAIPFWFRVGNQGPRHTLNFFTGYMIEGRIEVLDTDGVSLGDHGYQPGFFIGVSGSIRF